MGDPLIDLSYRTAYRYYSKKQQGIFAGVLSSTFSFLPARAFAPEESIAAWIASCSVDSCIDGELDGIPATVKEGMARQYDILKTWIDDPSQPMAQ